MIHIKDPWDSCN